MRKSLIGLAIVAIVAFLPAATAEAQMESNTTARHNLTGMVGYQVFDVTDELHDAGVELKEEITIDGRYEYRLTPNWGVEGFVTYSPAKADIFGDTVRSDVDAWYVTGGVSYNFLPRRTFNPFVFGGVGASILDVTGGDVESNLAGNFGAGFEVQAHRNWAIRAEVRDFIYSVNDLDPSSIAALGLPADFDDTVNDVQVSGGVTVRF